MQECHREKHHLCSQCYGFSRWQLPQCSGQSCNMAHMSCDAKQSALHQQHCTDLQLGLVIGTCSNCFHCASHYMLHAYTGHMEFLPCGQRGHEPTCACSTHCLQLPQSLQSLSQDTAAACWQPSLFACHPHTVLLLMPGRSVSFVASTAYPSTDSPNCSLLRFAARYTDCKRTLLFCKRFYKSRTSDSCSGHTVILPHGCAACPLSACKEVCVVLHHVYHEHVFCWRTHSC